MTKYHQGYFKPKNPSKYKGDVRDIVYRSGLELSFMRILDTNPAVTQWSSEEFYIPYWDPVTRKQRRYFPDFIMKTLKETFLIETKPSKETIQPILTEGMNKRKYQREVLTWATNNAKWKAATDFSKEHGFTFKIITERDLGIRY